VGFEL